MSTSNRYILGISAFYHDSAAALVDRGNIVAAAQEERFTRVRHDASFPQQAVEYCMREAGIDTGELDWVVFYDKPLKKFDRILETHFGYAPRGFLSFAKAMPQWVRDKLFLRSRIRAGLGRKFAGRLLFVDHHESHAASAFFPSPFEDAAILTMDGVGEWATTTWGVGTGNRIELRKSISFPHSLGLLYSAFTYFTGFKVNSGEYKLMGLAPFGRPTFADVIKEKLIELKDDGSFRLSMEYFTYPAGLRMTGKRFADLFGGPPRRPESPITQREMDLAASIQAVTEEIVLRCARHIHSQTGMRNLCLAGGVALNCVANGVLLREGPFERIWIQPAAGDAGGSLGAALFAWHQLLGNARTPSPSDSQKGSLLGPRYTNEEIRTELDALGARYEVLAESALIDRVAQLLAQGQVVGWFHGRMEFGPRALGARSLLGDARSPTMQRTMNLKIKFRESFRPFAPCVLRERAHEIFDWPEGTESPYMLLVANVRDSLRKPTPPADSTNLIDGINVVRSEYPAITHVDYSARIQTVDEERHGRFYRLMKAFEQKTGSPVLVNTSFNVRGEPIVNRPKEALDCFFHTDIDALVLEDCLLLKEEQPARLRDRNTSAHLAKFGRD